MIVTGRTPRARWTAPGPGRGGSRGRSPVRRMRVSRRACPTVAGVKLRVMQPNIPQDDKFKPENREAIMRHYLTLSDRATSPERSGMADVTHLDLAGILLSVPAGARPAGARPDRSAAAEGSGADHGSGARGGSAAWRAQTALLQRHPGGGRQRRKILDSSDKAHLVPFGEYLPFSDALTIGSAAVRHAPGGFDAGSRRKLLNVPGLPPSRR